MDIECASAGWRTNTYENTTRNITHETYAVIALLPNLSKSGHVLIIEALTARERRLR